MSNLSTFYPAPITAADLGLGPASNATFGSIQNTPIGNTTPNSGAFTTLTAGNGASGAPSITFASTPTLGFWQAFGNIAVSSGATVLWQFRPSTSHLCSLPLQFGSNGPILANDGNHTLAQVSTTNPQTFNIYNTFTNTTNYERGFMRWSSNVLQIGTEKAGTGSARALELQVDGTTRLAIASNGGVTVSAGLVGTGNIRASSFSCGTANNGISFGDGFTFITGPSTAGVLSITAFNNTDVLVRLGGTSSSWPALNTSGSTLRIRLADNTGFAPLSCGALTLNGNLDASAQNIVTDTTTGTKIGTGTTQKIGFFNATPVVQQAAIADATDAATTQARLNDLLATMRTFGLIAT